MGWLSAFKWYCGTFFIVPVCCTCRWLRHLILPEIEHMRDTLNTLSFDW